MDNKFNAVVAYRSVVSYLIHRLLLPQAGLSITKIASELHITIGQCSKVYHGVCSLSPEKFIKLFSIYSVCYGSMSAIGEFEELLMAFENGAL